MHLLPNRVPVKYSDDVVNSSKDYILVTDHHYVMDDSNYNNDNGKDVLVFGSDPKIRNRCRRGRE